MAKPRLTGSWRSASPPAGIPASGSLFNFADQLILHQADQVSRPQQVGLPVHRLKQRRVFVRADGRFRRGPARPAACAERHCTRHRRRWRDQHILDDHGPGGRSGAGSRAGFHRRDQPPSDAVAHHPALVHPATAGVPFDPHFGLDQPLFRGLERLARHVDIHLRQFYLFDENQRVFPCASSNA